MLHIILGILKLIGLLFCILFLLILLNAAIFLLVPVRYQIMLEKTETVMKGQIRLTWLLHLISARLSYDVRVQERQIEICILGISLEKFKTIRSRRREKKLQKERAKLQKERAKLQTELKTEQPQKKNIPLEKADTEEKKLLQEARLEDRERSESKTAPETGSIAAERTVIHAFWTKLTALIDRIVRLAGSAVKLIEGIAAETVNFYEKLSAVPEKIDAVQQTLEEYEVKAAAGDLKHELNYIWKHYGLRRTEGYLHFGTGDPAMTGQLTGVLYMLLPAKAGKVAVQPEFSEQILEMELTAKGYVRSCHIIPVGWRLLRNKRLVRLFKKIRTLR